MFSCIQYCEKMCLIIILFLFFLLFKCTITKGLFKHAHKWICFLNHQYNNKFLMSIYIYRRKICKFKSNLYKKI